MRSNPTHHLFFIFQLDNILRSNLNFSNSYMAFYMAWRKNYTQILTYWRGDLSRRFRHRLCTDWLIKTRKIRFECTIGST